MDVITMASFGKWVKETFKKDPLKVSPNEIKRDQIKIDRLSSIKRDEIDDINKKIEETIKKGVGQTKETKISLSYELSASKNRKTQLQKTHENLMRQKRALNMLEFMVEQKNSRQVSTIANQIFDMDMDKVSDIASEFAVEGMIVEDKMKALEGAMVGIFGEERLSKDTEELLEQWDQLEAGEIDVDKFKETVEKQSEKMIVKRETETI
ncbi:MAG: hypothetical protein KKD46_00685 [Euryarchaeota archaeon]|nr:hypothetical protein [Euryarchaeota archaeon]MBU4339426.1 hypothetical protein [Euryarchaeota archaeon]MCG2736464.1 hypothetical protein [Candidatus Methanoperedenaceae archaeon]